MTDLTTDQRRDVNEALRATFTPRRLQELFEYGLGRNLDLDFADDYRDLMRMVVREAASEGWADQLVTQALIAAPAAPALLRVAEDLGLGAGTPPRPELERLVDESERFSEPDQFLARYGGLLPQICQIEFGDRGVGTGFLVAADEVLTNHHVMDAVIAGDVAAEDLIFRFDYKRSGRLRPAHAGTEHRMAPDNGIVDFGPPTSFELGEGAKVAPADDELDYALVRLAGAPGREPVGGPTDVEDVPERGWITIPETPQLPDEGRTMFVFQHPSGATLKVAQGPIGSPSPEGRRVGHGVNTLPGSSGSPCLDANLELCALHQAGDPIYADALPGVPNQAIPIELIRQRLVRPGVSAAAVAGGSRCRCS